MTRRRVLAGVALTLAILVGAFAVAARYLLPSSEPALVAEDLPASLSDTDFWMLIDDVSEPNGYFRSDNLLSNELGFQYVIPELTHTVGPGGVYLGVGPEQNLTYITALQPKMAIIVDIRRGNLHLQLLYKALLELSADRAEFVSRLFSRPRPSGLDTSSSAEEIFTAYLNAPTDDSMYVRTLAEVKDLLVTKHHFPLTNEDLGGIEYVFEAFLHGGPTITYNYPSPGGGFAPRGGFGFNGRGAFARGMPSYVALMMADDGRGSERSYLASEANFRWLKGFEARNLLVPVVGDFAGPRTLRAVGQYVRDRGAHITTIYTSNVEQYLFQQGNDWRHYYDNVGTLPLDRTTTFIRSIGNGAGVRTPTTAMGVRLPTVLCSAQELLTQYRAGKIRGYRDMLDLCH